MQYIILFLENTMNTGITLQVWQLLIYSAVLFVAGVQVPDSYHEKSRIPSAIVLVLSVIFLITRAR